MIFFQLFDKINILVFAEYYFSMELIICDIGGLIKTKPIKLKWVEVICGHLSPIRMGASTNSTKI